MKAVCDACVLYPTVMREILLGVAATGWFSPHWSDRILEEWARAVVKLGPEQEIFARGEIAVLKSKWPASIVPDQPEIEATLYLPDAADCHVLASAIASDSKTIITMNLRDFPANLLGEHGVRAIHPDLFLRDAFGAEPQAIGKAVRGVHVQAEKLFGATIPVRTLLKKAGLPRLGKALA